jgi:hypothetical protein
MCQIAKKKKSKISTLGLFWSVGALKFNSTICIPHMILSAITRDLTGAPSIEEDTYVNINTHAGVKFNDI